MPTRKNQGERFYSLFMGKKVEILRKGWPDFLVVESGHAHFTEVKFGKHKLSKSQKRVRQILQGLGLDVRIFRVGKCSDGSGDLWGHYENTGHYNDGTGMRVRAGHPARMRLIK